MIENAQPPSSLFKPGHNWDTNKAAADLPGVCAHVYPCVFVQLQALASSYQAAVWIAAFFSPTKQDSIFRGHLYTLGLWSLLITPIKGAYHHSIWVLSMFDYLFIKKFSNLVTILIKCFSW